jgi:hypothetical protein
VQIGGGSASSSTGSRAGVLGAAAAATGQTPAGTRLVATNGSNRSSHRPNVLGARTALRRTGVAAELPFTGLTLLLVVLLGLGAMGTGLGLRGRVPA